LSLDTAVVQSFARNPGTQQAEEFEGGTELAVECSAMAAWEFAITQADDVVRAGKSMDHQANDGWELVSGATSMWADQYGKSQKEYTMFWRRRLEVDEEDAE
jgi:hypothetical protein